MEIPISLLEADDGVDTITLRDLQLKNGNKPMVIDFWHTKCTRCPAALEKLNDEAEMHPEIMFVSCALSQGPGNRAVAADLVGDWGNMIHIWMEMEAKELAKAAFNFTAVPFYAVISKDGDIIGTGEPKAINYMELLNRNSENSNSNSTGETVLVLDEDF